jgi:hypothetical protein
MRKIRLLDLFSGIGGISYALDERCKTVAYCEKDDVCARILRHNMEKGRLTKAPIFGDVRDLTPEQLSKCAPDMISAGFPCQDISGAHPGGMGIKGERSGLFFEILRVVDLRKEIRVVFLENSNHIVNMGKKGIDTILKEFHKRGFQMTYVVQSSGECGSPHRRLRWFALGVRNLDVAKLPKLAIKKRLHKHDWSREPCSRVVPHGDKDAFKRRCVERCQRLGNSVVPQSVVRAWNTLVSQHVSDCSPYYSAWPARDIRLKVLGSPHIRHWFPTPTYNAWQTYRTMTYRSIGAIGNMLYNEEQTYHQVAKLFVDGKIQMLPAKYRLDTVVSINPNFVEWMMGYPKNWTI